MLRSLCILFDCITEILFWRICWFWSLSMSWNTLSWSSFMLLLMSTIWDLIRSRLPDCSSKSSSFDIVHSRISLKSSCSLPNYDSFFSNRSATLWNFSWNLFTQISYSERNPATFLSIFFVRSLNSSAYLFIWSSNVWLDWWREEVKLATSSLLSDWID